MALTLTPIAARRIRDLLSSRGLTEEHGVRLGVKTGGCSGFSYTLDFDRPAATDRVFESEGVRVICDPKSYLYINGTEVDFDGDLMNGGFRFGNPNVKRSCGCGSSFSV